MPELALALVAFAALILMGLLFKARRDIVSLRSDQAELRKAFDERSRFQESRIISLNAIALGRFGKSDSIEPLIAALMSDDQMIREAATETLASIGRLALRSLATAARGAVTSSNITTLLMRCAESAEDLLGVLATSGRPTAVCEAVLSHRSALGPVLDDLATHAPIAVLPRLLALPAVQNTSSQKTAQHRLQEEAERQRVEEERSESDRPSDSWDSTDSQYETGTCDCRYR